MADTATNTPTSQPARPVTSRYTVIPLPKVVFFYPLMFVSIFCGIMEAMHPGNYVAGTVFAIFFFLNVLVISFDFPGIKALALFFGIIAVVFGLILFDMKVYAILGPLSEVFRGLSKQLTASPALYFCLAGILFAMIGGGFIVNYLWNRWTIEPNRLYHTRGILADKEQFPVIDLRVEKKVEDVFEYILLLSGTLTFIPNPSTPPMRLENVALINRAERKIHEIVRSK
jgi:hypothetical protein